jgi:acetylxylan esterase
MHYISAIATLFSLASLGNALNSSLQHVTGFTAGPTAAGMYIYVPTTKVSPAPIIVAMHGCVATASAYFSGTLYAQYADTHGYIVIYPNSPSSGGCWDVSSTASLTHNGGGDSKTIINMVSYAVSNYGGDASRVYATGTSSGAMMTNVLAGAYPDIIKAGSAYSGVPDGCFYVPSATPGMSTPAWNSQCAQGNLTLTAEQWGKITRMYYPGYTGSRPKMLMYATLLLVYVRNKRQPTYHLHSWHGTIDTVLYYENLAQELLQWSNVLGVSFAKNNTNTPQSGYTQIVYGDGTHLIGYSALNVGHTVPVHETTDLAWFGITG